MRLGKHSMTHFDQALEFIAALTGFFAAIIGLVFWLTYLEQTLHRSQPRTASSKRARVVAAVVRDWAKARRDSGQVNRDEHRASPEQARPDTGR